MLNADGSFSYDPTGVTQIQQLVNGQSLIDTFVYRIRDLAGELSNEATVTITVLGINDPPVTVNDQFAVGAGQTRQLAVLANDFDVDSQIDPSSVQIVQAPSSGTATVLGSGQIQYAAQAGFKGTVTLTYTVRDMEGNLSNPATVTVVVNNAPVAGDDVAFTYKNQAIFINVLSNDFDSDGTLDPASVQIVTPPPFGTAQPQPNGTVLFTPQTDWSGELTFTYIVADNTGILSNVATVLVRVQNSRWQNPSMNMGVNADGGISAIDALLIINYLNTDQPRFLPDAGILPPPYLDVNGDERVSALDALLIINHLNTRSAGGGSEGEASAASVELAMMVTPQQMINSVGPQVIQQVEQSLEEQRQRSLAAASPLLAGIDGGSIHHSVPVNSTSLDSTSAESLEDLVELLSRSAHQSDEVDEPAFDDFFSGLELG